MHVINKELYHFNYKAGRKDIWAVGNVIYNTKDYISDFYNKGLLFNGIVKTASEEAPLYKIIDCCLQEKQTDDTYIVLLREASRILKCYESLQRELILEQVRKELYPDLISRKNAIYLCDKNQLEHWRKILKINNKNPDLFKVCVTGEIFISNDDLLPGFSESVVKMYEQSKQYWNPDLTKIDKSKNEYLFQGKLKVLEKIE